MMTRCTLWRDDELLERQRVGAVEVDRDGGDDLGVDAALAQLLAHDRDRVDRAGHEAALRRHRGVDGPARESAQADEQRERRAPDDEDVARIELHGGEAVVHEPQQQRVDRGHLQQPRRLVERGLVQDQLVALVQAADLADEDDRRRGGHAEHQHGVVDEQREHGDDDEHRRRGVGDRERAPVEPLADRGGRPDRALGDELRRPRLTPGDAERALEAPGPRRNMEVARYLLILCDPHPCSALPSPLVRHHRRERCSAPTRIWPQLCRQPPVPSPAHYIIAAGRTLRTTGPLCPSHSSAVRTRAR